MYSFHPDLSSTFTTKDHTESVKTNLEGNQKVKLPFQSVYRFILIGSFWLEENSYDCTKRISLKEWGLRSGKDTRLTNVAGTELSPSPGIM